MKLARLSIWLALPLLAMSLTGCPASQQVQAAEAVDNAAIALLAAQNVETAAHNQGLISAPDDIFIQTQFKSLSVIGTTADSCIGSANTTGSAITCLSTAINGVDQINSAGGLALKSPTSQADFEMGISAVRDVLSAIETSIGGVPPPVPGVSQ